MFKMSTQLDWHKITGTEHTMFLWGRGRLKKSDITTKLSTGSFNHNSCTWCVCTRHRNQTDHFFKASSHQIQDLEKQPPDQWSRQLKRNPRASTPGRVYFVITPDDAHRTLLCTSPIIHRVFWVDWTPYSQVLPSSHRSLLFSPRKKQTCFLASFRPLYTQTLSFNQ